MRMTMITPCFNAAARLPATIGSVLEQAAVRSGKIELEYWICDGGSKDGSAELARALGHPAIQVLSEPDRGMYHALGRGFSRATGDVIGYINAGDRLLPGALDAVCDLFADSRIKWLTGTQTLMNGAGQVVWVREPFRFRRRLIRTGLYGRRLPFIQQESTFWRREMLSLVDFEQLSQYKLAGDYFLWSRFASACEPVCATAQLGAFTVHPGQLSEDRKGYFAEVARFRLRPGPLALFLSLMDLPLWFSPRNLRRLFNPGLRVYDHGLGGWVHGWSWAQKGPVREAAEGGAR